MTMNRQQAIYDFIVEHNKAKGYSPSVREIGAAVELKSSASVHRYLKVLEKTGFIKRLSRSARAIEIVADTPSEVQIVKMHKEIPSVIRWQGRRYVFDPLG